MLGDSPPSRTGREGSRFEWGSDPAESIYIVDASGHIVWCNDALSRLLGSTRGKLLGRGSYELHPPTAARWLRNPPSDGIAELETELRRSNGAVVQVTMSVEAFRLGGGDSGRVVVLREPSSRAAERFQRFLEGVPDATVVVGEDGRVIRANALIERLFGYEREELVGRAMEVLLPERLRARHVRHRAEYFRNPVSRAMGADSDLNGLHKDGREFPVEISLSPLEMEGGKAVVAAVRDITERKRLEASLREREELFRKAFEEGPIGMAIVDMDLRFQRVNATLCRQLGYDEDELTDRTFVEVTHPDDVAKDVRLAEQVFRGEIPYYQIEKRYLKKTGETIWAHLSASVVRRADGTPLYGLAMVEDITARKLAEQTTRRERERLRVTLKSIGDAVIAADTEGIIGFMNPVAESLTGYDADDAVGRPLDEVFRILDERTRRRRENPVPVVLRERRVLEIANDTLLKDRDGREVPIADSAAPIEDDDGELYGAVLVFRDMSERRRIDDELLRAKKVESIGVLAGGIAHDFNNLLTVIQANLSLVRDARASDEKSAEWLDEADDACGQAASLTKQLLTFSSGGAPVRKTISLAELVREATRFALRGSNVRAEMQFEEELWPVDADVSQFHQVIHNLLLNAAQSMPGGGTVGVRARNLRLEGGEVASLVPGRYVEIAVEDHGIGIPRRLFHRIFDPYFTTKPDGNGLGLATVYGILARHDGAVVVESTVGAGSTFRAYLTASEHSVEPSQPSEDLGPVPGGRILIMDDEKAIRRLLDSLLTSLGYRVDCVSDGEEAVALYADRKKTGRPYSAVILDLTVPGGMGGREAMARLREVDPEVKAIVSSGYSYDSVMAHHRAYGFRGVVEKPYNSRKLAQVLRRVLLED